MTDRASGLRGWQAVVLALVAGVLSPGWAATVQVQVQGSDGKALPGAVVFLDSPDAARATKPMAQAEMAQENKTFRPDVLVVTRGTAVHFPNRDTVRHHVYSFSPTKKFELKLYTGTPASPVIFDTPGVAVLGCNIHDAMVAWVVVVDTPYHGRSSASGAVTLSDVPPGNHSLRVWHPRLPVGAPAQAQPLKLTEGGGQVTVRLTDLQP